MSIHIKIENNVIIQCPICFGIGRVYPLPLLCSEESDCILHEGPSGIECPNCEGLGKIDT